MQLLVDRRKEKRKRILKWTLNIVFALFAAFIFAFVLIYYVVQTTTMSGQSMEPNISNGDKLIVNKVAYLFSKPKRYDVVAIKKVNGDEKHMYVKRIVGLPGETIQIKDGEIYINEKKLEKLPFDELIEVAGLVEEPMTLDDGEYFVIGDNCNNSEDSRFSNVGNIDKTDIVGKVHVRK